MPKRSTKITLSFLSGSSDTMILTVEIEEVTILRKKEEEVSIQHLDLLKKMCNLRCTMEVDSLFQRNNLLQKKWKLLNLFLRRK